MITNPPTTNDIRDIKPPFEIASGWMWLWWMLAILAVAALLYFMWRRWQKRRTDAAMVPVIPPHVRAKQRLEEALGLIAQPKPFCIAVSDTVRIYLEERFRLRAPERTTDEFLRELKASDLLKPEQKESLGEFLNQCDMVKFAKYEPGETELRALHQSAVQLVLETEPETPLETSANTTTQTPPAGCVGSTLKATHSEHRKGKALAVTGVFLQLAPVIWIFAYVSAILRLMRLDDQPAPTDFNHVLESISLLTKQVDAILGDLFLWLLLGLIVGFFGLVCLIIAMTWSRYRAEWFFWFLLVYGAVLFTAFPFGTPFSIFFVVYCLTKRKEFLKRA